jgi:uncharacterized integral membrane protein
MKYLIFSFLISIIAVVFALQNAMIVHVSFLAFSFETSLVVVILMSATFGVLMAWPPAMIVQFRLNRQISGLEQDKQTLEEENKHLKEELAKLNPNSEIPPSPPADDKKEINLIP